MRHQSVISIDSNPQETRFAGFEKEIGTKRRNLGSPIRSALIAIQTEFRNETSFLKPSHVDGENARAARTRNPGTETDLEPLMNFPTAASLPP